MTSSSFFVNSRKLITASKIYLETLVAALDGLSVSKVHSNLPDNNDVNKIDASHDNETIFEYHGEMIAPIKHTLRASMVRISISCVE